MFLFNESATRALEEEDELRKKTSDRKAIEISEENMAYTAENKILKEQNKIDDVIKNDYEKKKLDDNNFIEDKIGESEKFSKQAEYRQFLLKQIEDKEKFKKSKNSPEIRGNSYTYSEELMTPEVKKNLKLTKQQEMKNALDECIRQKNALKLKNKEKELEEEKTRSELWKKREAEQLEVREKAKQMIEIKEQRKEEVARQWNTNKDDEREQFIDSLMKKDPSLSQLNKDFADTEIKDLHSQEEGSEISYESEEQVPETVEELKEEHHEADEETKENEIQEVGQQD